MTHAWVEMKVGEGKLTIAILVLWSGKRQVSNQQRCATEETAKKGRLTKREKASLNSETCSSVRESACGGRECQPDIVL